MSQQEHEEHVVNNIWSVLEASNMDAGKCIAMLEYIAAEIMLDVNNDGELADEDITFVVDTFVAAYKFLYDADAVSHYLN